MHQIEYVKPSVDNHLKTWIKYEQQLTKISDKIWRRGYFWKIATAIHENSEFISFLPEGILQSPYGKPYGYQFEVSENRFRAEIKQL